MAEIDPSKIVPRPTPREVAEASARVKQRILGDYSQYLDQAGLRDSIKMSMDTYMLAMEYVYLTGLAAELDENAKLTGRTRHIDMKEDG